MKQKTNKIKKEWHHVMVRGELVMGVVEWLNGNNRWK
jgi:hypothetical protein